MMHHAARTHLPNTSLRFMARFLLALTLLLSFLGAFLCSGHNDSENKRHKVWQVDAVSLLIKPARCAHRSSVWQLFGRGGGTLSHHSHTPAPWTVTNTYRF
jgi:hypothetical protein